MIRINQIKLQPEEEEHQGLIKRICRLLHIPPERIQSYEIVKKSIDARKKNQVRIVYSVSVEVDKERKILSKVNDNNIMLINDHPYRFSPSGTIPLEHSPVVVGTGPAGLICSLMLARAGYQPIVLERGRNVEERTEDVRTFWEQGRLSLESNVAFGEGGAGTFSDGKLNTLVHDKEGRGRKVLEIFVEHGAPSSILYDAKPHIGTDVLCQVVKSIREEILSLGGTVRFQTRLTDLVVHNGKLQKFLVENEGRQEYLEGPLVLATGHSARDTFAMLHARGIPMEAKSFAVGVRIQHPQDMINRSQYGETYKDAFGAAPYKLTAKLPDGRGVYTFCMCPGGYVVNASSQEGMTAVNGMSYSGRDGINANSAVILTVTPKDYPEEGPLAGVAFQQELERRAFKEGQGGIPIQLFEDFCQKQPSSALGQVQPTMRGAWAFGDLNKIFPESFCQDLAEGITQFGKKLPGFDRPDGILAAVESRTSSPVRILRRENLQSPVEGIYPCGEGAGYAGGIMSAAMDGIGVFEALTSQFAPLTIH